MPLFKALYIQSYLVVFLLLHGISSQAQYFPGEGSKLHYRLIGFSLPVALASQKYAIEIARDSNNTEDDFTKNFIKRVEGSATSIKAEVPAFGSSYTWRAIYTDAKGTEVKSDFFHFSTLNCPNIDTSLTRLRVTKNTGVYKDAFIFSDITKVLYDMTGKPVWFLPDVGDVIGKKVIVRDLRLSPQGTITFLAIDRPYEITYGGKLLWQIEEHGGDGSMPNNKHYHHEFTRLNNGNYMAMGTELVECKINPVADSLPVICDPSGKDTLHNRYRKIPFGNIVEFDKYNKPVWVWRTSRLLKEKRLQPYFKSYMTGFEVHDNSFFFDERNKVVYLSSKHYSIIIKIKYPEGSVLDIFGFKGEGINNLFCEQHALKIAPDGNLYLFNNNECNIDDVPSIVMLKQPVAGKGQLKKVWEYKFPVQKLAKMGTGKHIATTGGNVIELPGKSVFASMCSPYSDMFIITPDKKVSWSGIIEKKNISTESSWNQLTQYRATIITNQKDIDRMLFNR